MSADDSGAFQHLSRKQRRALAAEARKRGPKSGTVVPPDKSRDFGAGHRAQKAREFCADAIGHGQYMLMAFVVRPDNAVEIKWSTNDFPISRFHDAAQLFTDLLNRELESHGISLEDMQKAAVRQAERLAQERAASEAAQKSELAPVSAEPVAQESDELDRLLNALPSSLGAPSPVPVESPKEQPGFDHEPAAPEPPESLQE